MNQTKLKTAQKWLLSAFALSTWKKVDAYISTISRWAKIPNIEFDRAKSALQDPLGHWTWEYSFKKFLGTQFEALFLSQPIGMVHKIFLLNQWKIKSDIWANAPDDGVQEYVFGINFRSYNSEKVKTTNLMSFSIFLVFLKFCNFQLNLWYLYLLKGTIVEADFYTVSTTRWALQYRITFGRFEGLMCFRGRNPME